MSDEKRPRHLRSVGSATAPNVPPTATPPPPATHPGSADAFQSQMPTQATVQPMLHLAGYGQRRGLSGAIEALLPAMAFAAVGGGLIGGVTGKSGRGALVGAIGGLALLFAERAIYDPTSVRSSAEKVGYGAAALGSAAVAGYIVYTE